MPLLGAGCRKESIMKNNYSIAERNRIVEEQLCCVEAVMRRNHALIRAARLEYDDVYQDLAICLILCVEQFDPKKGSLRRYIRTRLCKELYDREEIRRVTSHAESSAGVHWQINLSPGKAARYNCILI